ncbi:MAG: hypothetical protein V4508_13500 [Pseudomonadota bacterium]
MPPLRLICFLFLLLPASAQALTLRMCVDFNPHPPLVMSKGEGVVDRLVAAAAHEAGLTLVRYYAPVARCREELRAGKVDAFPLTPYIDALRPFLVFPMAAGKPDVLRSVSAVRQLVYRRQGSLASWNGSVAAGLGMPVLVSFGSVLVTERLTASRVPFDDNGKSTAVNLTKLMARRGDLLVGYEHDVEALLARPEFAGKVEALPIPFSDEICYLTVTPAFYRANRAQVERMWDAIGRLRKQARAQALENSAQPAEAIKK